MDLICRTCLAYDDGLEPLFSKKLIDTDYKKITTMILLCTGLEISEDDDLCNTICTQCIESIIAAFKYRKMVWDSNAVLLDTTKVMARAESDFEKFKYIYIGANTELSDEETTEPQPPLLADPCEPSHNENEPNHIAIATDDINKKMENILTTTPNVDENYKTLDKYIRVDDTTMRPYNCTICNQTYEFMGPLRKHLITNHNINVMKIFRCSICFKTFVDEKHLQRHLNELHQPDSMNRNHVCDMCGKAFKYKSGLREHINRHTGEKPFQCNICTYRTVASSALKVHLRSHTGEKPFVCHICSQSFKSSSHRGAHIKEAHSDGPLYGCMICDKTFKSRRIYLGHKLIHNPNEYIKCKICNKGISHRKNLKVHMRQHTGKTFKCTVCEKAFYQKQNCQMHMKKVHDIIDKIC